MTAHELLPKLKILYKVGINSILHHMDQKNFKTKAVIAKAAQGKQGSDVQRMQFPPNLTKWDCNAEI